MLSSPLALRVAVPALILSFSAGIDAEIRTPEQAAARRAEALHFRHISRKLGLSTGQVTRIKAIMTENLVRTRKHRRMVVRHRGRLGRLLKQGQVDLAEVRSELVDISREMAEVHLQRVVVHRRVQKVLTLAQRRIFRQHRARVHQRFRARYRDTVAYKQAALLRSRDKLQLTNGQYTLIKALFTQARHSSHQMDRAATVIHSDIAEVADAPDLDRPALRRLLTRMGAVKVERRMVRIKTGLAVARALKPEQRAKWKDIRKRIRTRRRNPAYHGFLVRQAA